MISYGARRYYAVMNDAPLVEHIVLYLNGQQALSFDRNEAWRPVHCVQLATLVNIIPSAFVNNAFSAVNSKVQGLGCNVATPDLTSRPSLCNASANFMSKIARFTAIVRVLIPNS